MTGGAEGIDQTGKSGGVVGKTGCRPRQRKLDRGGGGKDVNHAGSEPKVACRFAPEIAGGGGAETGVAVEGVVDSCIGEACFDQCRFGLRLVRLLAKGTQWQCWWCRRRT